MNLDRPAARVLVTGSVAYDDWKTINRVLDRLAAEQRATGGNFRVLTGMADGADQIARTWARNNDANLLAERLGSGSYPDPLHNYNEEMLAWHPELVLAFKDDFSSDWASPDCIRGTEHMCRIAAEAGIPVLLNDTTELSVPPERVRPLGPRSSGEHSVQQTHFGETTISVVLGDITDERVDVIVNAADRSLLGGGGVDGAIHRAAGPTLFDACKAIVAEQGSCDPGNAVITTAGNLKADQVVHAVGPIWGDYSPGEANALLARCYSESLRLTTAADASTIAFPNISAGVCRFPLEQAANIALDTVEDWLEANEHSITEVRFICFTQDNFDIYTDAITSR